MTDSNSLVVCPDCTFETEFAHVLRRYDKIPEPRVYTPWHSHAGFRWRLLIFPRGNATQLDYISVYLDCGGPLAQPPQEVSSDSNQQPEKEGVETEGKDWEKTAEFELILVHPDSIMGRAWLGKGVDGRGRSMDGSFVAKESWHRFRRVERDWGFLEFASFDELQPGGFADEELNVIVAVRIRVLEHLMT